MKAISDVELELSVSKKKADENSKEIEELTISNVKNINEFIKSNNVFENTTWILKLYNTSSLKSPPHLVLNMKDGDEKDSSLFSICKLIADYEFDEILIDKSISILSTKHFKAASKFSDFKICIYFDDINIINSFCKFNKLKVDSSDIIIRAAVLNKELQRLNEMVHVLNVIK